MPSETTPPSESASALPAGTELYPRMRYMGNKMRLLPWIHDVLRELPFESALDAFAGTGVVAYLMKRMGKSVTTNDFLAFSHQLSRATVGNSEHRLSADQVSELCLPTQKRRRFITRTFEGIFFEREDLMFLDRVWANLSGLLSPELRSLTLATLVRACLKRQPRGVFTVAGDPEHYKDGRRDLSLSLEEHFREGVDVFNAAVFSNGRDHRCVRSDIFDLPSESWDLVYIDPPYVPRSDDNCYIKRYHFLEGLMSYWEDDDAKIDPSSKVKKLAKRFTPFSYRRTAIDAFERLIGRFPGSIIVLSYSSNGWPDLDELTALLGRHRKDVVVHTRSHRYHFGTHARVSTARTKVSEYLVVGR